MADSSRDKAIDAVDILNDLIGDLSVGTRVLMDCRARRREFTVEQMSAVQKMCLSHLVLGFAKLLEFWKRYHDTVPDNYRADL